MRPLFMAPLLSALVCSTLMVQPAQAETPPVVYDRITLAATAQAEASNNLLRVVFEARAEQKSAAAAAEAVNRAMARVQPKLKGDDKIQWQTQNYQTQPIYDKETVVAWQVSQGLLVESEHIAHLADLMGQLQQDLHVQSVSYDITDDQRRGKEDELIRQAIDHFNGRAELISRQLGASSYRIVNINIDTQSGHYFPKVAARGMAMAMAEAAPPTLEAGRQTLTVQVSGDIQLVR